MISRVLLSANWPGGVDFLPDEKDYPVSFWEGPQGPKAAGGRISLKDAAGPLGVRKLTEYGAAWFLPIFERMTLGENVTVEEIRSVGERQTGRAPEIVYERW